MISRRSFLAAAAAAGVQLSARPLHGFDPLPPERRLAFSTLGTPQWGWERILDFAVEHGFAAIELRTVAGTNDLPSLPEFASAAALARSRRQLEERGVRVIAMMSSARMHETEPARREAHMAEARRYVDLAHALGSPYVRVFPDIYPAGMRREEARRTIATALREVAAYARPRGVTVLLESHGDVTDAGELAEVMRLTGGAGTGILWDTHHTFFSGQHDPVETYRRIAPYTRIVELKDSVRGADGKPHYVLTGAGTVPLVEIVRHLISVGYPGYFSFEWEKMWHPELEDPAIALPHFVRVFRQIVCDCVASTGSRR